MRPRVIKEAEEELLRAMLFYEDHRASLGASFYDSVTESILAIGRDPLRIPIYEGKSLSRQFRRAPVTGFSLCHRV